MVLEPRVLAVNPRAFFLHMNNEVTASVIALFDLII